MTADRFRVLGRFDVSGMPDLFSVWDTQRDVLVGAHIKRGVCDEWADALNTYPGLIETIGVVA